MEDDKSVVSPYGMFIIGCASLVFSIILHVYWLEKYNELTGHKTFYFVRLRKYSMPYICRECT